MTAIVVTVLFSLGYESPCAQGGVEAGPSVSVLAIQGWAKGDWSLQLQSDRIARVRVAGHKGAPPPVRALTNPEQERLTSLVDSLPTERRYYSFGKTLVDVTTDFELSVGMGSDVRKYHVGESLADSDDGPELRSILQLLNFLHGLVGSKQALPPPPIDWRARKQQ